MLIVHRIIKLTGENTSHLLSVSKRSSLLLVPEENIPFVSKSMGRA